MIGAGGRAAAARPADAGRWALVDARTGAGESITAATRLAGLPLVCRLLRLAARRGYRGALLVVGDVERPALERALTAAPPPDGFDVELAAAPPDAAAASTTVRSWVTLDGRAVYDADELAAASPGKPPMPLIAVRTPTDLREADERLYHALRKRVELDGAVAYYVMRPVSRLITRVLIDTPVTPNQVTMVCLLSGIFGGMLASRGGYAMAAIAGVMYFVGTIVDCVDGELARLRVIGSKSGEWLDTIADDVTTYGLLAGLGVGLWRDGAGEAWLLVAVVGSVGGVLIKALMYWDLHRNRLPIDTAVYPWFFGDPARPAVDRQGGPFARLWYVAEYIFRRDAYATIVMIVLLLGAREVAAVGLLLGGLLMAPALLVHFAVMAHRRRARPSA